MLLPLSRCRSFIFSPFGWNFVNFVTTQSVAHDESDGVWLTRLNLTKHCSVSCASSWSLGLFVLGEASHHNKGTTEVLWGEARVKKNWGPSLTSTNLGEPVWSGSSCPSQTFRWLQPQPTYDSIAWEPKWELFGRALPKFLTSRVLKESKWLLS